MRYKFSAVLFKTLSYYIKSIFNIYNSATERDKGVT